MTLENTTQCLMGSPQSSFQKGSEDFASDPATFLAGLAVRRNSSGLLSVTKTDGMWAGISLGQSLSANKNTTVLKGGDMIPVLLQATLARVLTITSFTNLLTTTADTIKLGATTFTAQSGTVTHGGATFQAATSNTATATSLADQINHHAVASLVFLATPVGATVKVQVINDDSSGAGIQCLYTDVGGSSVGMTVDGAAVTFAGGVAPDYVVIGANVYFSDTTGKADDPLSGSTVSNAIYMSAPLNGVQEDGSIAQAAYISMAGGL